MRLNFQVCLSEIKVVMKEENIDESYKTDVVIKQESYEELTHYQHEDQVHYA